MNPTRLTPALLLATSLVFSAVASHAQQSRPSAPQARLSAAIADTSRATLAGSQPPRARLARDLGAVDGSTALSSMTLYFSRSAQQQADLNALIAAQQDPSSPQYHQWLTAAQFGARFGMADSDIARTEAWLESQGFTITGVSPSRNSISFAGTASIAASAFGAPLHHYSLNGKTHIAPSADLSLPSSLSGIVADVRGLSDFRPRPHVRYGNGAAFKPNFTSSQTGNHFLTPGDIGVLYDIKAAWNAGYTGTGQTIAIMGQSAVSTSDITSFQAAIGQTAKAPNAILVPNTGISQTYSGDESESDLDLEYASGIAPGATIDFIFVGANATASVFDSLTWAIQNRVAPILNISYGECEPSLGQSQFNSLSATLQQAAAQGQTIVSAAGDDGSTDCYVGTSTSPGISLASEDQLAVDFPSSSQYVTGIGGTELPAADVASGNTVYFSAAPSSTTDALVSAVAYDPHEAAWNDDSATNALQYGLSSGGGGVSIYAPAPSWQTGVPGIPAGATNRLVPDLAFDASPNNAPYAYCSSDQTAWASGQLGSCSSGLRDSSSQDLTVAGGTSFAAPIFSGMVAIINQARGYTWQGLVNPTLYTLASSPTTYASAFHDITSGSNACNLGVNYCSTGNAASFSAGVGYDEATGLGSVDLNNLVNAWPKSSATGTSKSFTLAASALSITQSSSTSSATGTSTITITPQNGYTGTIAWTVLPSATVTTGACYSLPSTTVSGNSPVTATLTVTTGSSTCASGTTALLQKGAYVASRTPPTPSLPAPRSPAVPVLAGLGIISLSFFVLLPSGRRNRRLPTLLAVLVLAGVGVGLSGCGGGSNNLILKIPPTPISQNNNYTITVIGTDTSNSSITGNTSLAFTLTVQ